MSYTGKAHIWAHPRIPVYKYSLFNGSGLYTTQTDSGIVRRLEFDHRKLPTTAVSVVMKHFEIPDDTWVYLGHTGRIWSGISQGAKSERHLPHLGIPLGMSRILLHPLVKQS